jgi:hypothetical protein
VEGPEDVYEFLESMGIYDPIFLRRNGETLELEISELDRANFGSINGTNFLIYHSPEWDDFLWVQNREPQEPDQPEISDILPQTPQRVPTEGGTSATLGVAGKRPSHGGGGEIYLHQFTIQTGMRIGIFLSTC